jgi:hypothetical protein
MHHIVWSCTLKIAYLTNQYPKISHTFIRREIEALEGLGVEVLRYSVRPSPDVLIDAADRLEVPLFTGVVRARYPLRTQSEPLPDEIELSSGVVADLDRLLDGGGGALHTPPAF